MKVNKAVNVADYPVPTKCPYCGGFVELVSNAFIYGRTYGNGKCYACLVCRANVGIHTGTTIPLGRLANKDLTDLRKQCHTLLDPLWRGKGSKFNRTQAYAFLAHELGISYRECHIAWFDRDTLLKAIDLLKSYWSRIR